MRIDDVIKPPTWVRLSALSKTSKDDPVGKLDEQISNSTKPAVEEPAMIHPFNTSTIKIRNNGIIDLWVGTDQGIRIDPNSRTVNMITDTLKEHLNSFRAWVTGDLEWWAKSSFLFNSEQGGFTVNVKDNINFLTQGYINFSSLNGVGFTANNIGMESNGALNINTTGDINLNTKGSIYMRADQNLILRGVKIVTLYDEDPYN